MTDNIAAASAPVRTDEPSRLAARRREVLRPDPGDRRRRAADHPGEVVALVGPNGAGKSTTIDAMLGLTTPDTGSARLFGLTPTEAVRRGRVGAMLQTGELLPHVTVGELLGLVAALHDRPHGVAAALKSGGQVQRVRFALSLVADPDLLVLDEQTTGMDVESRAAFWDAMRAKAQAGGRWCSPRTTWRRPTHTPTGSCCSPPGASSPTAGHRDHFGRNAPHHPGHLARRRHRGVVNAARRARRRGARRVRRPRLQRLRWRYARCSPPNPTRATSRSPEPTSPTRSSR